MSQLLLPSSSFSPLPPPPALALVAAAPASAPAVKPVFAGTHVPAADEAAATVPVVAPVVAYAVYTAPLVVAAPVA